jgi:hypothetical protein
MSLALLFPGVGMGGGGIEVPGVGDLVHSPADLVRRILIALAELTDPDNEDDWPGYYSSEPSLPDNVVTCYDTTAKKDARIFTGRQITHFGVQVRIRSTTPAIGYLKSRQLATALDRLNASGYYEIEVGDETYLVHAVSRVGDIAPLRGLGLRETPQTKGRSVHVFNLLISFRNTNQDP